MKLLLIIFCFVSFQISFSQIILKGSVTDIHDSKGLHNAIIKEKAHREYCFTDSNGNFTLKIDHPGIHTFTISHPGCKKNVISINILNDTFIYFYLDHQENTTKKITITGSKSYTPNEQVLIHDIGKDIGTRIQELQGAALMQTGSNINKPMINGMHSQRLIMNFDNMRFESQQWGSEHAPEIDPNAIYKARLIQGSEALQYGSEGISGIIKLEPNYLIQNNKKFSGSLKTGFATNGNKFFGALDLKGTFKTFHYFIQTSSSKQGNLIAPNYYLMNTGLEELNFNTGISFKIKKINISSYYSRFYNNLGVLSASHIGNIDDLQEAIKRGNPIDKGNFSYTISVPSQKVFHEIIKASIEIPFKKNKLNIDISNQYNIRNEYDL